MIINLINYTFLLLVTCYNILSYVTGTREWTAHLFTLKSQEYYETIKLITQYLSERHFISFLVFGSLAKDNSWWGLKNLYMIQEIKHRLAMCKQLPYPWHSLSGPRLFISNSTLSSDSNSPASCILHKIK